MDVSNYGPGAAMPGTSGTLPRKLGYNVFNAASTGALNLQQDNNPNGNGAWAGACAVPRQAVHGVTPLCSDALWRAAVAEYVMWSAALPVRAVRLRNVTARRVAENRPLCVCSGTSFF